MKNKKILIIVFVIILLLVIGLTTYYIDNDRVRLNHEPKFCIKVASKYGFTYWGMGYKVIRHVRVSPYEPYENNIGSKIGSWFMGY